MEGTNNSPIQPIRHTLSPCTIFAHNYPSIVYTELLDAVSVFLYDKKLRVGGVNHFIRPYVRKKELAKPMFGNAAMIGLIKKMIHMGTEKVNLEAQIFGGATLNNFTFSQRRVARKNVKVARKFLKKMKIKVVSEDTGGNKMRKVYFNTASNEVIVLKSDP
ncbi:MAG: chemotaxis protein CheD [Nitrospinae bacterium]|nr:chemotaxis protein CheD [Nitrospinota bacterium]